MAVDNEQKSVQAALESVGELKGLELSPKLPNISTSLKMLRAIKSGKSAESVLEQLKPAAPAPAISPAVTPSSNSDEDDSSKAESDSAEGV